MGNDAPAVNKWNRRGGAPRGGALAPPPRMHAVVSSDRPVSWGACYDEVDEGRPGGNRAGADGDGAGDGAGPAEGAARRAAGRGQGVRPASVAGQPDLDACRAGL